MYLSVGNTEMNDILNLFFCTCHGVSHIRKTFQRISIVFYNVRLFNAFVFSISIIKIRESKRLPLLCLT